MAGAIGHLGGDAARRGRGYGHGAAFRAEINVTPLVDVVLVLLVIFMVVTPMLRQEAPVDLPVARASRAASGSAHLALTIAADGSLSLDGEPLARERLGERLASIFAGRPEGERVLFLSADRSLSYEAVIEVIDACRAAGVTTIGLLTRRAEGESPAAPPES